jgi:hypothetical protein
MVNPGHYESEDGVFNLPLFLYDSLRDIMKSEFDQIRSTVKDTDDADRVVRLIKNRYQNLWSQMGMALFRVGLVEPCDCKPKEICPKCSGAQWIIYKAMSEHADEVLRLALTRRMQSPEFEKMIDLVSKKDEKDSVADEQESG